MIFAVALGNFAAQAALNVFSAASACGLSSAFQISARAFFAPGCADLGSAARTLAILWNQQRCSLVPGKTSRSAPQNPSVPSPAASTGARIPRREQSRRRSAHDSVDSR